jgi:RNA-directed DNA polymerase
VSLLQVVKELNTYLRGWLGYYKLVETPTTFRDLDSWIRRRLRCFVMKQWIKSSHTRFNRLTSLGVNRKSACSMASSRKGPWALSNAKPLKVALPNRFFAQKGLICLLNHYDYLAKTM